MKGAKITLAIILFFYWIRFVTEYIVSRPVTTFFVVLGVLSLPAAAYLLAKSLIKIIKTKTK